MTNETNAERPADAELAKKAAAKIIIEVGKILNEHDLTLQEGAAAMESAHSYMISHAILCEAYGIEEFHRMMADGSQVVRDAQKIWTQLTREKFWPSFIAVMKQDHPNVNVKINEHADLPHGRA
jgi:hypothetical protein